MKASVVFTVVFLNFVLLLYHADVMLTGFDPVLRKFWRNQSLKRPETLNGFQREELT